MSSAPSAPWTEHRTPEGRPYWYHTVERRSVWEKPSELKTPRERALEATPWKEYKSGDRSYYVHSVTKQSTWVLPPELKQVLDQYSVDGASPRPSSVHPTPLARSPQASQSPFPSSHSPNHAPSPNPALQRTASTSNGASTRPPAAHTTMAGTPELNFKNDREGAEAAFTQLLRDTGVDVDWTWETTMRSIITNPLYKALKTIAERKAAFNKYVDELRRQRAAEREARLEELKPSFKRLIEGDQRIKPYSSFETARKLLSGNNVWKQTREDEARALYDAVMKDIQGAAREEEAKIKKRNKEMLLALLKTFEADVFTRWRDAHRTIVESPEYTDDAYLPSMDLGEMLQVFEELIASIERDADSAKRREVDSKRRKERMNRDAFKALLRGLEEQGKIKPRSTWGEVYPLIKNESAFLNMLGQPGSTPLDLFYDLVDSLDQQLEKQTADALHHISSSGHSATPTTTEDDFLAWTTGVDVPRVTLQQIYRELVSYLAEEEQRKHTDERRRLERKFRQTIEDLRYAFKKVDPPLDLEASWEEVRERVEGLPEFKAAEGEDQRVPRWAWDKFVRRQKEKRDEMEGRKRKERDERGGDGEGVKRVRRDGEESEPEEGEV